MRTYSRKKPENKVIEDVLQLCRLCLEKTDINIPLFPDTSKDEFFCALPLRIMICVGLEIKDEECLPNMICMECFKELERSYVFRKKCEVVYQKLKSHVHAIKDKESQKVHEIKIEEENLRHLVIDLNDKQQNFQSNHTPDVENLNSSSNHITIENEPSIEIQDNSEAVTNVSTLEIDASNTDMSLILSTILIELGVLQQNDNGFVIVDENLQTVELEGDDSSKIVLELVEEDEQPSTSNSNQEIAKNIHNSVVVLEEEGEIPPPPRLLENPSKKKKQRGVCWECAACGRRLASRSALVRHERRHSGERPFACAVCQRSFTQREVMLRHALVHQARRPHACPQCPKSFTQRGALEAHLAAHAPAHRRALRLHTCPACDKVFLYASGLSRHMRVHSGKVFECDACSRHFRDKSSLRRHLRSGHGARCGRRAPRLPHAAPADPRADPAPPTDHDVHIDGVTTQH